MRRAARRVLPGHPVPPRRHAVGGERAARDRRVRRGARRLDQAHRRHAQGAGSTSSHMAVIERSPRSRSLGGHAFAIVGYNEVGFLVQNSWGTRWGRGGFATLPYDDWLGLGVRRLGRAPGVPTPSCRSDRTREPLIVDVRRGRAGRRARPGPSRPARREPRERRQALDDGRFASTPGRSTGSSRGWPTTTTSGPQPGRPRERRPGSSAHRDLRARRAQQRVSTGLTIAWKQLNWWLNNRVYPITFAWQSGPSETLVDQLSDLTHAGYPPAASASTSSSSSIGWSRRSPAPAPAGCGTR